jgi:hypothetical protein
MQTSQTKMNETVLDTFYPERLNQISSTQLYSKFVGTAIPENNLYIVLGTDSGLLVEYLEGIATAGQRFICLDFPEVIDYLKESRKKPLSNKIELCTFEDFEFENLYEKYQDYVIRNAIILFKSLMVEEDQGLYQGIFATMDEAFHRFRVDRADNRNHRLFYDQQLENVCDLMHPISKIKNRLKGEIPAIILGGGPSLDSVIPWLKQNQKKIWIFAASRICKRLIKEGITPDFIGVIDPQPLMFEYAKEMNEFYQQSILLTGEHPCSKVIRQWRGLKAFSRRRFPWSRHAEENDYYSGPTISNALLGMSAYLGVSKLYLAGIDFCFTLEGLCHESGSVESQLGISNSVDTQVTNYRGDNVGTNIQLYDARNIFESQVQGLQKQLSEFEVSNLNSGAAIMEGVDYQSIEGLVLETEKFSVVNEFSELLDFDAASELSFLTFLKSEVKDHSKWLFSISKESGEGLVLTRKLFEKPSKSASRIKSVIKIKTGLEKLVGADYQIMVNYAYQNFMETLQPIESEGDMSHQEMKSSLNGFFGGLNKASTDFLGKLQNIRDEIEKREWQINPNTPFSDLFEYWAKSNMPGLFYVWLDHYAEHEYDFYKENYPSEVLRLEVEYQKMMSDDSALESRFNSTLEGPDVFVRKLQESFQHKRSLVIQETIRQLISIQIPEYIPILAYARGLLLEVQGESKNALEHYLNADSDQKILFIQQQIYPLAFSLNQTEVGLKALESLCQMDCAYISKFADSLAILGNIQGAIEMYKLYPLLLEDTNAVIRLMELQVQIGNVSEANELLQQADGNPALNQVQLQAFVDSLNAEV